MKLTPVVLLFLSTLILGCGNKNKNIETESTTLEVIKEKDSVKGAKVIVELEDTTQKINSEKLISLLGIYRFKTPQYFEGNLVEDHYLVLKLKGGNPTLIYYGTSDDFDDAREGYLPGFFRSEITDFRLDTDSIFFSIDGNKLQFFERPVSLSIRKIEHNEGVLKWPPEGFKMTFDQRDYKGKITDTGFLFEGFFEPRKFEKVNDGFYKQHTYNFFNEAGYLDQTLELEWLTDDSLKYSLETITELCEYSQHGIAINQSPKTDLESDTDHDGNSYFSIEYQVKEEGSLKSIRVEAEYQSKAVLNYAYAQPRGECDPDSKVIMKLKDSHFQSTNNWPLLNIKDACIDPLVLVDESRFSLIPVADYNIALDSLKEFKIQLLKLPNWSDPGDFHKISISNDSANFSLTNLQGWIRFNRNNAITQNLKDLNQLDSDLVLISKGELNLLVLFGWPYASQPGLCTIIDLDKMELLMNLNAELQDIVDNGAKLTFANKIAADCESQLVN